MVSQIRRAHQARLDAAGRALITHVTTVDSTNRALADAWRSNPGLPTWRTIVAEHQTGGRGRYDRTWVDAPGHCLLFSTLVRIPAPFLSWVSALAGMASVRAAAAVGYEAGLKWPNDLIVRGRKVGGILAEHLGTSGGAEAHGKDREDGSWGVDTVVVGVGINGDVTPSDAGAIAGCLVEDEYGPIDRDALLEALLRAYRDLVAPAFVVASAHATGRPKALVTAGRLKLVRSPLI